MMRIWPLRNWSWSLWPATNELEQREAAAPQPRVFSCGGEPCRRGSPKWPSTHARPLWPFLCPPLQRLRVPPAQRTDPGTVQIQQATLQRSSLEELKNPQGLLRLLRQLLPPPFLRGTSLSTALTMGNNNPQLLLSLSQAAAQVV